MSSSDAASLPDYPPPDRATRAIYLTPDGQKFLKALEILKALEKRVAARERAIVKRLDLDRVPAVMSRSAFRRSVPMRVSLHRSTQEA
jgi:hypothetical protein